MEEPDDCQTSLVPATLLTQIQAVKKHQRDKDAAAAIAKPNKMFLLTIPQEIRNIIWRFIRVNAENELYELDRKPENPYRGLLLSCRQLYLESQREWIRRDVPWSRLDATLALRRTHVKPKDIQSLLLEIPQDAKPEDIKELSIFLRATRAYLRELRLYFYGSDLSDRPVYTHNCGKMVRKDEPRLRRRDQRWESFKPLWLAIAVMHKLQVLVISNANIQVFYGTVMSYKPHLEYLSITTDPRSRLSIHLAGLPIHQQSPTQLRPALRCLSITANASISSARMATRCIASIEHLTWTIPADRSEWVKTWFAHTARLITILRAEAHKLNTLRLCIGDAYLWENDNFFQAMTHSFRLNLKHVRSLRRLELHITLRTQALAMELLRNIPPTIQQLYLSDRMVSPYHLKCFVADNVLGGSAYESGPDAGLYYVPPPRKVLIPRCASHGLRSCKSLDTKLPHNSKPWWIRMGKNGLCSHGLDGPSRRLAQPETERSEDNQSGGWIQRKEESDQNTESELDSNIIAAGEEVGRDDFIDLGSTALRFVDFDYTMLRNTPTCDVSATEKVLWMNGRLHDRLRNIGLCAWEPGSSIPPAKKLDPITQSHTTMDHRDHETATSSGHQEYAIMLFQYITDVETQSPRDRQSIAEEWALSQFWRKEENYFGNEEGAQRVFAMEPVARAEDLEPPYRLWVEDVWPDEECEWACPGGVVPPLAQRDELRRRREAELCHRLQQLEQQQQHQQQH